MKQPIMVRSVTLAVLATTIAGGQAQGNNIRDACMAPSAIGCFVDPYSSPDGPQTRVLTHTVSTTEASLTHASCIAQCCSAGFGEGTLAGLRNGTECYCAHGLGPYDIPEDSAGCRTPCSGAPNETCGGVDRIQVLGITTCPSSQSLPPRKSPKFVLPWSASPGSSSAAGGQPHAEALQVCGQGCTACPSQDTCCIGKSPDAYRVPGGYVCMRMRAYEPTYRDAVRLCCCCCCDRVVLLASVVSCVAAFCVACCVFAGGEDTNLRVRLLFAFVFMCVSVRTGMVDTAALHRTPRITLAAPVVACSKAGAAAVLALSLIHI